VTDTTLRVEEHDDRVVVTLSRPSARNAINAAMVRELHDVCAALEERPRLLLLTGDGGTFAAGADIGELRERGREQALQGINSRLFDRVARLPMPTVAAVDGYALGGGAELAYACDVRLASPAVPNNGVGSIDYADRGAFERVSTAVDVPFRGLSSAGMASLPLLRLAGVPGQDTCRRNTHTWAAVIVGRTPPSRRAGRGCCDCAIRIR